MNEDFDNELTGSGQQNEPQQQDPPAAPSAAEFAALNARLEAMAEESRHNRELLTQFLTRQQPAANATSAEDDEEVDEGGDIADDFATNGIEALRKRGVLTKKEAKEMFETAARKVAREEVERSRKDMIADTELLQQFPGLSDPKSEMFTRTQDIYNEQIKRDPSLKGSPQTLPMAARIAKAELIAEGRADARQDRITRQSGDRSTGRGSSFSEDDSDDLSPTQRSILERFNAAGDVQISEESYRKRAGNVRMGGVRRGY